MLKVIRGPQVLGIKAIKEHQAREEARALRVTKGIKGLRGNREQEGLKVDKVSKEHKVFKAFKVKRELEIKVIRAQQVLKVLHQRGRLREPLGVVLGHRELRLAGAALVVRRVEQLVARASTGLSLEGGECR